MRATRETHGFSLPFLHVPFSERSPLQATTLEVPPHMQLESSFALPLPASASLPDVFELVRQFDRRTVFHDHRLKAPSHLGRSWLLGLHALLDQLLHHVL